MTAAVPAASHRRQFPCGDPRHRTTTICGNSRRLPDLLDPVPIASLGGVAILYAMGARPNFVKMAPVIAALHKRLPDERHVIVDTGQHYDRMMSAIFVEELGVPRPDYVLGVGSGSHAAQTARVMERIEPVIKEERPDLVIVPGDVNSTLAVALVSVKLGVSLAHVEAGLRSFDRTMPEEINRIVADEFSKLSVHPFRRGPREPCRGGDRCGANPLRRQYDDRHPGGDGNPVPPARGRGTSGL